MDFFHPESIAPMVLDAVTNNRAFVFDHPEQRVHFRETYSSVVEACYDAADVPTVVFGPGSIEQAHTAEEWVPLAEVEQASETLWRMISEW